MHKLILDRHYKKPALSLESQLQRWVDRGLQVPDPECALFYLGHIGYFRLSGYAQSLQVRDETTNEKRFLEGVGFKTILNLYIFDRELRLLVLDAIERIEVAVKSSITNVMSMKYGPHWYLEANHFQSSFRGERHERFLAKVARNSGRDEHSGDQNQPCRNYFNDYDQPQLPPSWMMAEVVGLNTWCTLFSNLKDGDRNLICEPFQVPAEVLESWLRPLCFLRTICIKQQRLWNLDFPHSPKKPDGRPYSPSDTKLYPQLVMLQTMISRITEQSSWSMRLFELINKYPRVPGGEMGFPEGWYREEKWGIY